MAKSQCSLVRRWVLVGIVVLICSAQSNMAGAGFGKIGSEFVVNTYTTSSQTRPSVAPQTDGGFTIVWTSQGQDGDGGGVFSQGFDASGTPIGIELMLNQTTAAEQINPAVALVTVESPPFGPVPVPYTIWESNQGGNSDIIGLIPTFPLPSELVINTTTAGDQSSPRIAARASGGFIAAWDSFGGSPNLQVVVQAYDSSYNPLWPEISLCAVALPCANPSVVGDTNDGFAVSYLSVESAVPDYRVRVVRFNAAGLATGSNVIPTPTGAFVYSDIARLPNGDFIVVRDDFGGSPSHIYGSRFSSNAALIGTEFVVNSTSGGQIDPQVAVGPSGDFVVAWQGATQLGIFARHYDSSGVATGTEFQVNTPGANEGSNVTVTSLSGGDYIVAWDEIYTSGSDVVAQRLGVVTETPTFTPTWTPSGPSPTPTATPVPNNCPLSPASGCRTPGKSVLLIKDSSDNTKDKLIWKWIRGTSTTDTEFGDPVNTRAYAFCVYDDTGRLLSANIPAHATKWRDLKYKDLAGSADGIQKIILKPSATANTKVLVKGKGNALPDLTLGAFTLPLQAQLVNDETSLCFEATYGVSNVIKNDATQFKAKVGS